MNKEKTVEVNEEYLESLQISRMRADICKMATDMKSVKDIRDCYYIMNHRYSKEIIERSCTVDEIAEEISNNLLYTILSLFRAEAEETRVKEQVVKYFEEEIELRKSCGLLQESNN